MNDFGSVLLIGGRDAGKSNFLFRLWIAVNGGGGALVADGLPSDMEYLRAGAERLLEGTFAERTAPDVRERVEIPVRSSRSTLRGKLVVPDVPGEEILAVYRSRQWTLPWEELVRERCACLLFVRAGSDEIIAPLDWAACFDAYGAAPSVEVPHAGDDQEAAQASAEPPTQVVLTEWLQFLRTGFTSTSGGGFRPRIGIVVSAWDRVPVEQQSAGPHPYLKMNFPLFAQFIEARRDQFEFQLFGLSIVNGDLKNDPEFKEAYLRGSPSEFGIVYHSLSGSLESSPDITLPVAWALGLTVNSG